MCAACRSGTRAPGLDAVHFGAVARRYPLEPLIGIRRDRVARGAEAAAAAAKQTQTAEVAAEVVLRERAGTESAAEGVHTSERAALEQGGLRASDLQQAARFDAGVSARLAEIRTREQKAAERVREARSSEARAKAALGTARAEQKVVQRHQQRFDQAEATASNEREEEAALERWSASKRGAGER
jgi:hypothetical protein